MLAPELLPLRSIEEQLAGVVRVRLDGQAYTLPVLSRRDNREWKALMTARLEGLFAGIDEGLPVSDVMQALMGGDDIMTDLVRAYDKTGVLPPDDELQNDTDAEWLQAFLLCMAASHPFVALVMSGESTIPSPARKSQQKNGHEPTSSPRPNTRGRRASSKAK